MKKIFTTATLFLFFIGISYAQEMVNMQMMQKIKDEEKNNSQIAKIAHDITDVSGPRLTNSPGYKRALDIVTELCKSCGIENASPEAWGEFGKGWSNEIGTLALKAPYYENIIAYPIPWSKSTRKNVRAELVMLDRLDTANIDKLGDAIKEGETITVDSAKGTITVSKENKTFTINPIPPFMEQLIADGGLMKHIARK